MQKFFNLFCSESTLRESEIKDPNLNDFIYKNADKLVSALKDDNFRRSKYFSLSGRDCIHFGCLDLETPIETKHFKQMEYRHKTHTDWARDEYFLRDINEHPIDIERKSFNEWYIYCGELLNRRATVSNTKLHKWIVDAIEYNKENNQEEEKEKEKN